MDSFIAIGWSVTLILTILGKTPETNISAAILFVGFCILGHASKTS